MGSPLAGRRVIELGTMVASPFATHILAQLGAEVVKVEAPTGDTTRNLVRGGPGGTFIAYSHGKRSVAIDMTTADGAAAFRTLAATADAVVHNLSPAAARKLGVTRNALAEVNPDIVCCHIRGYGDGPQADDLATNPVAEAATGVMADHLVDGRPSRLGPSYHDQFAGAYAVIRLLAAWLDPAPTAADRRVDIGLYETGLHVASRDLAGVQLKTQLLGRPEKEAGGEFAMPGYGAYRTADDRWVYLLVLTDAHWRKLTAALAMPEADDPGLARLRDRKKQRERVEAAVRAAVGVLAYEEAATRLRDGAVGFTEVLPLDRVLAAPQARHPGKLRTLDFRGMAFELPEFPGGASAANDRPPPELGADGPALLRELGYDAAAAARLIDGGAIRIAAPEDFAYAPVRDRG